ncbi:hypothetical protein ASF49_11035 [Methylobacterium sp. Leaf104]|uniref:hypothetical protein n=1 Tax=Methylobacterium TaxID=407 RepID=UPI0006FF097E|nr:hypothetical protein [Methylobacterium sp. Leaf104]KQP31107.1 hypothetical protein ASF49_11035 [Methylobacterium sp. Leaf104]MCI9881192.1 hypothetical protein [Methylobacterium goesingense]
MTANQSPGPTGAEPANPTADWKALRGDVEGIADVAAERGRTFVEAARSHATDYIDQRKGDAARSVTDLAKSVRESSKTFEAQPNIRAFFDSAADGLEHLGTSIEERSFSEFYEDAEAFARRAPVAVAVATFLTGFVVARFIKSTSAAPLTDTYPTHNRL